MGAAISSYDSQRRQLRQALIMTTIQDPGNKDILGKIAGLRKLVIENPHLCATAAREAEHKFDYSPTSLDAAYHELDRLFTIYEAGRILKSAKMRKGPVACPLGHHAVHFASVSKHPQPKPPPVCGICDKRAPSGYYCSYCNYNVCMVCSVVYCTYGHEMTLWSHEESDHNCVLCKRYPIHAGYRCNLCDHYDICDLCTYKDGRAIITKQIFARMEDNLKYMREKMSESPTAEQTIRNMKKSVGAGDAYPTILHLVRFAAQVADTREVVRLETILTRITKEVNRLRAVLVTNPDICKTHAMIVKEGPPVFPTAPLSEGHLVAFSTKTVSRLSVLVNSHFMAKSVLARSCSQVACPLGHAAVHFKRNPGIYNMQGMENGVAETNTILPPYCKICSLLAEGGHNCSFCEYDLCETCAIVYCAEGHAMVLWTIPEARGQRCYVCNKEGLTAGYHCQQCFVNLCDMCTRKERRLDVREKWDRELQEIITFMAENKKRSDMARYLSWRQMSVIGSLGVLCDYVRDLRVRKMVAEKQIKFKSFIDKMKALKSEIILDIDWSATAVRESNKHNGPDGWFFRTKREAKNELRRLRDIVELYRVMKGVDVRLTAGVACVLGHAMVPLKDSNTLPKPVVSDNQGPDEDWEDKMAMSLKEELEQRRKSSSSKKTASVSPGRRFPASPLGLTPSRGEPALLVFPPKSTSGKLTLTLGATSSSSVDPDAAAAAAEVDDEAAETTHLLCWSVDTPVYRESAQCRACLKDALTGARGGKTCFQCEYDLCQSCLLLNCRRGHVLQIWTNYDAIEVSCDLCDKLNLIAGYHCSVCSVDICDRCTRRDMRESLKLWPKRDIRRLLSYYEGLQADSDLARKLVQKTLAFLKSGGDPPMSELCALFVELDASKSLIDEEIRSRQRKVETMKYSLTASDF